MGFGNIGRGGRMIDEKLLMRWLMEQIDNPQLTKDMKIILGVLQGTIDSGAFDYNQQWREEVHTYTVGHNENETVVVE